MTLWTAPSADTGAITEGAAVRHNADYRFHTFGIGDYTINLGGMMLATDR